MSKILVYLKGFTDEERLRLAEITALWLATGQIPPTTLRVLINEHQVKDGMTFKERNLGEVVTFRKNYAAAESRNGVLVMIKECIEDEKTPKEIIIELKDSVAKNNISEQDALIMIWNCVMSAIEWNKKEDLLQDQAL